MFQFCTISTADHLYKAHALFDSLKKQHQDAELHVLIVDGKEDRNRDGLNFFSLDGLSGSKIAAKLISKYSNNKDKLRWSLKPVFLNHLISKNGISNIIYVDNDIFFYNDYRFLFDYLKQHSVLLTPHNYPRNPNENQIWLEANYRVGLFNAGFVGVNKNAAAVLEWWAECCAYRTEKNAWRGLYDDQKYLDLIPVMVDDALILKHKGCNVADWNGIVCPRSEVNGEVMINGKYPVIFIHFNVTTLHSILVGKEPFLKKKFEEYFSILRNYKPDLKEEDLKKGPGFLDKVKLAVWRMLTN